MVEGNNEERSSEMFAFHKLCDGWLYHAAPIRSAVNGAFFIYDS
jgi:hypothetical protein